MSVSVVIGVDCAVSPNKQGLAVGHLNGGQCEIRELVLGTDARPLSDWVFNRLPQEPDAALIAMDVPLGWPAPLAQALAGHHAGKLLGDEANSLFLRETDRFIQQRIGAYPFSVGADKIARTAHASLRWLNQLRQEHDGLNIPLAWDPHNIAVPSVIEVYPSTTLITNKVQFVSTRRLSGKETREVMLGWLREFVRIPAQFETSLIDNPHLFDAVVCVIAGLDFINGQCFLPENPQLAIKEGWIWVRDPVR
jgi:predicted RNase H-like nuclease